MIPTGPRKVIVAINADRNLHRAVPALALILAAVAVYVRILGHDFQLFWDDDKYIVSNQMIHGLSADNIKRCFTTFYFGNYAPLHLLSYMLDYSVWGLAPRGYFLTNMLLHLTNGLLFHALLVRGGMARLWAFLAAFIFLFHPVQVENVAWVSERKSLLALFFMLLAFAAYQKYRERAGRNGKGAYAASFAFFICALLSKAVAVVFPLILLLYDACFLKREEGSRRVGAVLPFFMAALAVTWLTVLAQTPGALPGEGGGLTTWHGGSPYATFLTMLTVLLRYLQLVLMPVSLSVMYDPPVKAGFDGVVVAGAAVLVLLAAAALMLFRSHRKAFFFYGIFFIGLVPVSQVIPIATLMNDRYLYLPLLGAAGCTACLGQHLAAASGWRRNAALAAAGVAVMLLPVLSFLRAGVWRNDLTLWSDAVRKSPDHPVALYGLGQAQQNSGNLEGARLSYLRVLEQNPRHLDTLIHLGQLYRTKNLPLEGLPYLLEATRHYPALPQGYLDLGKSYYQGGELEKADTAFQHALKLQPKAVDAIRYRGIISLRLKRLDDARDYLNRAAALDGMSAEIAYNLACVDSLDGRPDEGLRHLAEALRLGFRDRESLLKDPDLAALRTLSGFNLLMRSTP